MPMTAKKLRAYREPKTIMALSRSCPARKATNMTVGMGNLPEAACSVATMRPNVAAGKMSRASAAPINGTMDKTETHAMNKKNKPVKASG